MIKIARSVHSGCRFDETHLVGIGGNGLPGTEPVAEGVFIKRVTGSGQTGNLGRILKVLMWQPRVYRTYRGADVSAVAVHNVWLLPLGHLLSKRHGVPLFYNPHELETETYTMRGIKKMASKLIERCWITRCASVSVVNEPIAEWYADAYPIAWPVTVTNVPTFRDAEVGLRAQLKIDDDVLLFIHTGNLTGGRNIPRILRAFRGSNHHVVFLGDGHLRPDVLEAGKESSNIHWLAPIEPELVVAYVREADVGLCLIETRLDASDAFSTPNKLMESLAADRPPLSTDLVEVRTWLGDLADDWIIEDTDDALVGHLAGITRADVEAFQQAWPGLPAWDENVADLVNSYRAVLGR